MDEHSDLPPLETEESVNSIIGDYNSPALPSIYKKSEKMDIVAEATAIVASANAQTLPERRVGTFEMMEVLHRSLSRTILNLTNPSQRAFTALRELSDFVNMATTGAKPKIAGVHTDLLPVGHPLSTQQHSFSDKNVVEVRAVWMSADPRIADDFRPLVASAFKAPANSLEREYVMAKLEATSVTEVPREIILSLTAAGDPYGGGNSFLARSARARAQRRDRKGRFAWMGGGARVWLGTFDGVSTLFRFCGYDSNSDSFDLEIFNHPLLGSGIFSVPASKVEAIKAILPEEYLDLPDARPVKVDRNLLVDPASLKRKDAPTGWTKVSSANGVDIFRSDDGWTVTRYSKASDAPVEDSITRVRGANIDKTVNPEAPIYHIGRGSADGLVTDKPFASAQSWADTQALIAKYDKLSPDGRNFNKEEARKAPEGWTEVQDKTKSDYILRDSTGRYEAVSMAPQDNATRTRQYAQELEQMNSGDPSLIHPFDGAKEFDGNLESLFRLERVHGDGTRELVGYYQDLEDVERDSEVNQDQDQSDLFYQEVIMNTLQWGGNTVDFVDGNAPIDGYIVAHAPDVPNADGTLSKREEVHPVSVLEDPEETAKLLRKFAAKNADKLSQKGFYLGTWTDFQDVKDANGNVIDNREMLFLDVSEYVKDFNDAFDKAEERKEIAWYGVTEGESFYPEKERRRRQIFADVEALVAMRTPEEREHLRKARDEANERLNQVNRDGNVGGLDWTRDATGIPIGLEPGEKARLSPEMYQAAMEFIEADQAYRNFDGNFLREVFEMSDGFDPGGHREGLHGRALKIRDKYVGDDAATLRMNETLRSGEDVPSRAKEMDSLVNKSALKRDYVFFRGVWLDEGLVQEMNAGDSFYDRAFQSMSFNESEAQYYLDARNSRGDIDAQDEKERVVLRLITPKGMNAINVGQSEVVLRRNTKMTIVRKSKVRYTRPDGTEATTTYLDVDVEPQTKEEIDARTQGLVKKPQTDSSTSELFPDDGRGADGVGTPSPSQTFYRGRDDSGDSFGRPGFVESVVERVKERNRKKKDARALGTERLSNLKKLWSDAFDDTATTQPKLHTSLFENVSEEEKNYIRKLFFSLGISSDSYFRPINNPKREKDLALYLSYKPKDVARAEQINRALRNGSQNMKTAVMNLDRAINNFSRLKKDVVLYKAEDLDPAVLAQIEVGDVLYERAYSVATLNEEAAKKALKSASGSGKVVYRMATPEGTPAVYTPVGVALPRNLKMSVVGKSVKDGITYIDVYVDRQSDEEDKSVLQGLVKNPDDGGLISPTSLYENKNPQLTTYYGAKKNKNIGDRSATAKANREQQELLRQAQEEIAPEDQAASQEQLKEAARVAREVADRLPRELSDLFDPSNPANILDAEIITDEVAGEQPSGPAPGQVDKDELLSLKVLFMKPNASWAEIDKTLQESSSPVAKEILRVLKTKYARIYAEARLAQQNKAKADVARKQALQDMANVYETLKNTFLSNQNFRTTIDPIVNDLIRGMSLMSTPGARQQLIGQDSGLMDLIAVDKLASLGFDPDEDNYAKAKLDIVAIAKNIFNTHSNDPSRLRQEMMNLAIDVVMGSYDNTDISQSSRVFGHLFEAHGTNGSVPPLLDFLPLGQRIQTERLLDGLVKKFKKVENDNLKTLKDSRDSNVRLASALSDASMEVLSNAGLEFNHGVKLSDQDINWHPPSDYVVSDDHTQTSHTPLPRQVVQNIAKELRTKNGQIEIMNEALSRMPKPVALLLKKWMIDNKNSFSTNGGTRGAVAPSSPSFTDPNYKHGDPIQNLRVNLQIDGSTKEEAVACAVHEMWHILANYALPGQLNGVEWARTAALTRSTDGSGKMFGTQVDSNSGVSLVGNSNDMAPKDNLIKLWVNEVSSWAPEFVGPYVGKYGISSGGLSRGHNPLASAEMMTSIVETLLGGGRGGGLMSPTDMNITGRKIRAGFNPDGTPRYITYNPDLIAEDLLPAGVTFVMLANELAKIKLGVANV
jgi:hypothetical protein